MCTSFYQFTEFIKLCTTEDPANFLGIQFGKTFSKGKVTDGPMKPGGVFETEITLENHINI